MNKEYTLALIGLGLQLIVAVLFDGALYWVFALSIFWIGFLISLRFDKERRLDKESEE
jgi:hypothetical protein